MSKFVITGLEDKDLSGNTVLSALVDVYHEKTNQFPAAIVMSVAQAKKFFFANNEIMSNFRGIPIEIEKQADERATIVKTINGIMAGMHINRSKDVADVYSLLENMKVKLNEGVK